MIFGEPIEYESYKDMHSKELSDMVKGIIAAEIEKQTKED